MILFLRVVDEVVSVVTVHLTSLGDYFAVGDRQESRDLDALALLAELHEALDNRSLIDLETTVWEFGSEFHHEDILANCSEK
jgi:hypothetical protein